MTSNTPQAQGQTTTKINLNPTSGIVGTSVTVTGSGFKDATTITITFDSTTVSTTTTSSKGGFETDFMVPASTQGTHSVTAQSKNGKESATAQFDVTSMITSCDKEGSQQMTFNPKDTVYCYGTGFSANTKYTVYLVLSATWKSNQPIKSPIETISVASDKTGNIGVKELWSSAQAGTYSIVVYTSDGKCVTCEPTCNTFVIGTFLVLPEYSIGALAALGASLVALLVYKRKSLPKLNFKHNFSQIG